MNKPKINNPQKVMMLKHIQLIFLIISPVFFKNVYAAPKALLHIEFNYTKTTSQLHPPYISAVVNDATDAAFIDGIVLNVFNNNKPITATDFEVKIESSNSTVVTKNDIIIAKSVGEILIKIKPIGVGYSNITITVLKQKNSESITIYYAASASNKMAKTYYHTGFSDASAAVPINENYMLVADDENNVLSVYNRHKSGLPITVFSYEKYLGVENDNSKEIDCEAAALSPKNKNIVYWIGSMGNGGKHFEEKPARSTLLCTSINTTATAASVEYKGYYTDLRKKLIEWGNKNGYHFSASTAYGEKPKQVAGFNVEGMCFAPDSTSLFIAFRAPLVPITQRKKALIAPIKNFETWFAKGHKSKELLIDKPIELDLDGRGFRDIIPLSNKKYLIVAGNADAEKNAAIYVWTGFEQDKPILIVNENIKQFNIEAAVEITNNGKYTGNIQLLCDDGAVEFYNDGIAAKNLDNGFKKFQSIIISIN